VEDRRHTLCAVGLPSIGRVLALWLTHSVAHDGLVSADKFFPHRDRADAEATP
jgi:hypothetical protein